MAERAFEDGVVVCRAGDAAETVFRIKAGALRIEPVRGPLQQAYNMLAGEIFGAEALLAGATYGATARARGPTVLEIADRAAVLAALDARPDAALPLIRAAFAQAEAPVESELVLTNEVIPTTGDPAGDPGNGTPRLMPATPDLAEQIGAEGVPVQSFPFVVGREESQGEGRGARGVDLILHDRTPYNLSRRHFAIEREGDRFVVRDCGSYHGTIVNGTPIGGSEVRQSAALKPGENAIIAGKSSSPIRFSITVR